MRKIRKEISLEPMTSRLPGVLPAYQNGKLMYFDSESLNKRGNEYPSNYGMIPVNLVINPATKVLGCGEGSYSLSWERLSKWFSFFVDYYNLIKICGSCSKVYSSATEYYDEETKGKYASEMKYGSERETYENMDNYFEHIGGKVSVSDYDVTDTGFFRYLKENIIPSFEMPMKYRNQWNKAYLYLPDVIKWIGWFETQKDNIGNKTCKECDDCCGCEKYKNLGGEEILDLMKSWYDGVKPKIDEINETVSAYTSCFIPSINEQINLQTSIDDLGEFSIFSTDYILGEDFEGSKPVVIKDDKTLILSSGTGFNYLEATMEMVFKDTDWEDYTTDYIKENKSVFSSTTSTVSGVTSSKLTSLKSTNLLVDDIGNEIEGIYNVGENETHQPKEGEVLELLYNSGNTANIMPFSMTITDPELITDDKNYFIGDIITNMAFYVLDEYDEIVEPKSGWSISSLATIASMGYPDVVYCDITYCLGATLERSGGSAVYVIANDYNSGVTYNETVKFVKTNVQYYLKQQKKKTTPMEDKKPDAHSLSYPVVCYLLEQNEEKSSEFNMNILTYDETGNPSYGKEDMVKDNNMVVYPVLRQEYTLGSASLQNVDADIYIDRGINSATDKHLKLGEALTMEALLNYGNGYFKIMNN